MKRDNYVTGLGWMFNEFGLKGNDAWVFALIYGFTQDGVSKFTGSINYVARTFNLTRKTVIVIMDRLEEKNLIKKIQIVKNNVTYNEFVLGSVISTLGSVENAKGSVKISREGSVKITPNNTNIYNTNKSGLATDFLSTNYQVQYETFLMQFKSQIKDFNKFSDNFNDTVIIEKLTYDDALFGRIRIYARNWIQNQNNFRVITNDTKRQADALINKAI